MKQIKLLNLGTKNKNLLLIGDLKFWFSYETLVAFEVDGVRKVIANYWGNTTGKLLNELEADKTKRLSKENFESEFERLL